MLVAVPDSIRLLTGKTGLLGRSVQWNSDHLIEEAIEGGSIEIVEWLLKNGARLNKKLYDRSVRVAEVYYLDMVQLLLSYDSTSATEILSRLLIGTGDPQLFALKIEIAELLPRVRSGHKEDLAGAEMAQMLLENGADPTIPCGLSKRLAKDLAGAKNFQKWLGITFDELVESTWEKRQQIHNDNLPKPIAALETSPREEGGRKGPQNIVGGGVGGKVLECEKGMMTGTDSGI
ncbi:hypothetical protein MMC18_004969 [Xylographa bjoerkii]|nr:hypothetical protein [Xylographa bjoerkii]